MRSGLSGTRLDDDGNLDYTSDDYILLEIKERAGKAVDNYQRISWKHKVVKELVRRARFAQPDSADGWLTRAKLRGCPDLR